MSLRVSGKNMDVGDALRTKAQEHIDALVGKYFDGGYDGHLALTREGAGFKADGVLHLDTGVTLHASADAADATLAYEAMAANVEKRLRRYKRRLKNHRRNVDGLDAQVAQAYVLAAPSDSDEEMGEDYAPPVIAEGTAALRALSVSEAVIELDLSGQDVVVFRHAGHGGLNVVYRRADGNIGWIDPALTAS